MNADHCLINQTACGRIQGNPVCPKCGIDERVVYPGHADLDAALVAARARYVVATQPAPELEPLTKPVPPEPPLTPKAGGNAVIVGVALAAMMLGGWWWKDHQDQRVRLALEHAAQQVQSAEQAKAQSAEKVAQPASKVETDRAAQTALDNRALQATAPSKASSHANKPDGGTLLYGRYQVLGDGRDVKDVETGLVWARCPVGQMWDGKICAGQAEKFNFSDAQKQTGNGWRVPTVRELHSLVWCSSGITKKRDDPEDGKGLIENWCQGNFNVPTLRQAVFPQTTSTQYWTSSRFAGSSDFAWSVNFNDGKVFDGRSGSWHWVRLVRDSQ